MVVAQVCDASPRYIEEHSEAFATLAKLLLFRGRPTATPCSKISLTVFRICRTCTHDACSRCRHGVHHLAAGAHGKSRWHKNRIRGCKVLRILSCIAALLVFDRRCPRQMRLKQSLKGPYCRPEPASIHAVCRCSKLRIGEASAQSSSASLRCEVG